MSQIVFRADDDTSAALAALMRMTGLSRSEVVRDAIRSAERAAVLARVREQAEAVRDDPADRAEMQAVQEDLEEFRAW